MTPFTKKREQWINARCVNVFDGKKYCLADAQTSKLNRAIPQTFGYVLRLYPSHLESKSLAPDGTRCTAKTRGLLQRTSVIAGTIHYVGKETDRRWDEGEDLSLLTFTPNEFQPTGKMVVADEELLSEMAKHSLRELVRRTGLSHHTLAAIKAGKAIRQKTLAILGRTLRASNIGG